MAYPARRLSLRPLLTKKLAVFPVANQGQGQWVRLHRRTRVETRFMVSLYRKPYNVSSAGSRCRTPPNQKEGCRVSRLNTTQPIGQHTTRQKARGGHPCSL